jgi:outer membrane lipoprotein-sorting protein
MKLSRRNFALVAAAFAALAPVVAQAQNKIQIQRRIEFTPQQREDLDRVSEYLNTFTTLAANFIQESPKGAISSGEFYLARPGKLRFEYRPPSPTLIVAGGGKIYVRNSRLNTVDSHSVSDTPLGLLLDDKVNLRANSAVLGIDRLADRLVLRARSSTNRMQDNIQIVFSTVPTLRIVQWTVRDAQGGTTNVSLTNIQTGVPIAPEAFAIPLKAPTIRKSGN